MAISKIILNEATQMDLTSTTAVASDVASGKVFFAANGVQTIGTASGSGGGASRLAGKNVIFFGDSISYGEGNNGHSYVDIINEMGICASLVKEAHTSSCVGPYQVYQDGAGYDLIQMIQLQNTAIANADVVFCAYGGNDSDAVQEGNVSLGDYNDASTATTVCGYVRKAIENIRTINPGVRICWLFPQIRDFVLHPVDTVVDDEYFVTVIKAMSDVCEDLNVPFYGLYTGLNMEVVSGGHLINDTAKHPNEAGQQLIAENVLSGFPFDVRPYVPRKVVNLSQAGQLDCSFAKLYLMVTHDIDVTIIYVNGEGNNIVFKYVASNSSNIVFTSTALYSFTEKTEYILIVTNLAATLYASTSAITEQSWQTNGWTTVFDGTTRIVAGSPNYVTLTTNETIGANDTWRVTWKGTAYTCTPIYSSQISGYYIGNPKYAGASTDTGEPFLAYKRTSTQMAFSTNDAAGNFSLKVEKKVS